MKDSGQAFPGASDCAANPGMTLRDYACIKLKIPDTGHEWLDELIQKSLLNDFAAKAMQGLLSTDSSLAAIAETAKRNNEASVMAAADIAYDHAGAMLKRTTRPAADESTND